MRNKPDSLADIAFSNFLDLPEKNREKKKRVLENWKSKPKKEKVRDERSNLVRKEHFGKTR